MGRETGAFVSNISFIEFFSQINGFPSSVLDGHQEIVW